MQDISSLQSLSERLVEAALKEGATDADAVAVRATATGIDVRAGALEHAERADGVEIGLRVLIGGRQACVSASDISDRAISEMAARAVAMAREAPVDNSLGLADPDQLARATDAGWLELADPSADPEPAALESAALAAEAAAAGVSGISQVESANASFTRRGQWLAASNGFSAGLARSHHSLSVVAITGEGLGMERDWAGESRVWAEDLPSPEDIGRLAAERTLARKGARKPPTGSFPILYDERVASGLIGHLLSAINGSSIARGSSWLRKFMDQQVLPDGIDLIEEPHRPRFLSSRVFDAEGLPTARRALVQDGVLRSWVLDLASGRKLGLDSTGNATRGASSPPSPGLTNLVMTQGTASRDDLISDMGRGLLVTSMLGSSINPTTGDYSRGAAGFWVENGQIAWPVNECTIAGNLVDMLRTLVPANDARPWRSAAVPSLLIEGMTVAGS